jgi:hypothetical protein
MEALGNIQPIVIRTPQPAVSLPAPSQAPALPVLGNSEPSFDNHKADQRLERLAQAARNAPQPLGTQAFTMFKDATGQVITRFRDTNSGRVTYIPEPNLLRLAGGGGRTVLNITA